MELRSDLGKVRGLGSSHHGTGHWLAQRLSGIALIPLVLWFVFSVVGLIGADLATTEAWVTAHFNPMLLMLLSAALFYHAHLGLQVVVEDYVHGEVPKTVLLVLIKLGAIFLGASCIFAVAKLTFA